jgi:hypothetical protein
MVNESVMEPGAIGREIFEVFEERIGRLPATILIYAAYVFVLAFLLSGIWQYAISPVYSFSQLVVSGKLVAAVRSAEASALLNTFMAGFLTLFLVATVTSVLVQMTRGLAVLWQKAPADLRRELGAAWASTKSPWKRAGFCVVLFVDAIFVVGTITFVWLHTFRVGGLN